MSSTAGVGNVWPNRDELPVENGHFATEQVLAHEFRLIHGERAWDPEEKRGDPGREAMINEAKGAHPARLAEQAELRALHAWSAQCLPGAGQVQVARGALAFRRRFHD